MNNKTNKKQIVNPTVDLNPREKIDHLNKVKTNPWVYIMVVAMAVLMDILLIYSKYEYSFSHSVELSYIITVVGITIAFIAIFIAYWNIAIEMLKTKYKRLLVDEEITAIPEELELDIDKNLIKLSYKYLDQYYLQTREHAQKGFALTFTVAISGGIIIIVGLIAMFFGNTTPAYVTTAGGVIVEFISAVCFYLYNKTVQGMNSYHKKLVISQNIALALKLANSLEEHRDEAKGKIIDELIKDINLHIEK